MVVWVDRTVPEDWARCERQDGTRLFHVPAASGRPEFTIELAERSVAVEVPTQEGIASTQLRARDVLVHVVGYSKWHATQFIPLVVEALAEHGVSINPRMAADAFWFVLPWQYVED